MVLTVSFVLSPVTGLFCSQTLEADNETLGRQFCSIGATQGRSRQGL